MQYVSNINRNDDLSPEVSVEHPVSHSRASISSTKLPVWVKRRCLRVLEDLSHPAFTSYLVRKDYVGRLSHAEVVIERHVVEQGGVGCEHLLAEKTASKQ